MQLIYDNLTFSVKLDSFKQGTVSRYLFLSIFFYFSQFRYRVVVLLATIILAFNLFLFLLSLTVQTRKLMEISNTYFGEWLKLVNKREGKMIKKKTHSQDKTDKNILALQVCT